MEKRTLYIVVAIVVAVVLVFSFLQLTGQAVFPGKDLGICSDTDNGGAQEKDNAHFIKGTVSYENRDYSYDDYCTKDFEVKEYYCTHGDYRIKSMRYHCYNGCVDGACVE